ncbi:ecdysteroid-regulated 16 kDa protein-like [Parasteatoda tepidariorum]|uniref:ecdysteroid-regulated 16 kDa protein-like n=1 Tax=Parasteatoda tepidariorum TaxID=114398 RepID=UPI001C72728A|nr:ecdysteroid-regulated 16 kDa protein-like [Parasteatoda tepidariorum]
MEFKHLLLTFVIFTFVSLLNSIEYKNCQPGIAEVLDVKVSNCDGEKRCPLYQGSDVIIGISFTPTSDIEKVVTELHGVLNGIPAPFKNPNKDGCHESGLICPLIANKSQYYNSSIFIKKWYPTIDVGVKYQLKDGNGTVILCVEIPSTIKNEKQN